MGTASKIRPRVSNQLGDSYNILEPREFVVTREAVEAGFTRFVDRAIDRTEAAFRISRVLAGSGGPGPGGAALDALADSSDLLHERVVKPELTAHRDQTLAQFGVVLDYAESDDDFETYSDDILAAGAISDSIRDDIDVDRRASVQESLLAHHRSLGDAVRPLIDSPETEFWPAVAATYDEPTARELVSEHFAFSEPLRSHRAAFRMAVEIDPGDVLGGLGSLVPGGPLEIEFTNEAIRAMERAERSVIRDTRHELEEHYDTEG